MNNIDKFKELFIEFEVETKKKVDDKKLTTEDCIEELKSKRINPYVRDDSFMHFCRKLRNLDFHNINDSYYFITDKTISKLKEIVEEVKHPYKFSNKETLNVFSK